MQRAHQGDVQFRTIDCLPEGAVPVQPKPLALGEHSGHCHILTGDYQLFEFEGETYAAVGTDGAMLQHVHENNFKGKAWTTTEVLPIADHQPIQLQPKQIIRFGIQQSYNPYTRMMNRVID